MLDRVLDLLEQWLTGPLSPSEKLAQMAANEAAERQISYDAYIRSNVGQTVDR